MPKITSFFIGNTIVYPAKKQQKEIIERAHIQESLMRTGKQSVIDIFHCLSCVK